MIAALLGNQNAGKTTLFNALTGSNQKVGNWPGVTIERKEGIIKGTKLTIVDLPGVYSLSPYTDEEEVSRNFVFDSHPDLIVNIVDATSIERSLYLTTQLLELDSNVLIALNMYDLVSKLGVEIDIDKLSKELGATIIPISAKDGTGIDKLIKTIKDSSYIKNEHKKIYPDDVELLIGKIININPRDHARFAAVKIIEEDRDFKILMDEEINDAHQKLEKNYGMDGEQLIASLRYDYIVKVKNDCVIDRRQINEKESITDKLDRVFLNKWAAIPIFIVIMGLVYILSVGLVGGLTSSFVSSLFNGCDNLELTFFGIKWATNFSIEGMGPWFARILGQAGASAWAQSLVSNGVFAGVGAVCTFIPQLIILFICLSILETTGYMSRIAFFLDRVFHKFGLSGKSLIPFIVGTGCSVPGIMSARTVEDDNEKKSTIILTPFIPCSAKLPIISLFAGFFFSSMTWLVSLSFYFFAIAIILLFGYIFKKYLFKGEHSAFISELPEYKLPSAKYVSRDVWDKTVAFIKRAGTVILLCSLAIWFLSSFTWQMQFVDGQTIDISNSMLASIGNCFGWFFYIMLGGNWSWAASVSSIQGLIAKEQVISSMSVLAGVSGDTTVFSSSLFSFFTPWSAYAFVIFNLFSAPCVASLMVMKSELGSWKSMLKSMTFEIAIAWSIASLIGAIGWMVTLK